jgi:hypothetical protein
MGQTTITVTDETKSELAEIKPDGTTWDQFLRDEVVDG